MTFEAIAEALAQDARSEATRRAYSADWRRYRAWCEQHHDDCDPEQIDPASVRAFLVSEALAGKSLGTIKRRMASLSAIARRAGQASLYLGGQTQTEMVTGALAEAAQLADSMRGMARVAGKQSGRGYGKATALTLERLAIVLAVIDQDATNRLKAARDRAVLTTGFAGLLRRSEIGTLRVADVAPGPDNGLEITIQTSDEPEVVPIHPMVDKSLCPVWSLRTWLDVAGIADDPDAPLFPRVNRARRDGGARFADGLVAIDGRAVDDIVRARTGAARARLIDAGHPGDGYRGHSPRRGGATSRAQRGATQKQIEKAGRWAEGSAVPAGYIEDARNTDGAYLGCEEED